MEKTTVELCSSQMVLCFNRLALRGSNVPVPDAFPPTPPVTPPGDHHSASPLPPNPPNPPSPALLRGPVNSIRKKENIQHEMV
ncbi:hypothetical protein N657DRAFT_255544 [Parathielavia appendiculata]|uniref:Uncharacterized protein n=1 Tax=Parathielavia appendiculata TaxID=2587402 RepID=A0AAN6TS26_9PEZI|nr:hypothetical protein N657DRAFT_255544 [Parathielavia appendiculata]